MTFNIYRDRAGYTVTDGYTTIEGLPSEAAAIDLAVCTAQDRGALYSIHYWKA